MRHETSLLRRRRRSLLSAVVALSLLSGCADRLTGPEAAELFGLIERQQAADSMASERRFWQPLGQWDDVIRLAEQVSHRAPFVTVLRDNRVTRYRALVAERIMNPPTGFAPDESCVGPRRNLILWDDVAFDAIVVMGGDYTLRVGRSHAWCHPAGFGPRPMAWAGRTVAVAHGETRSIFWEAQDGTGDISPGEVLGPCRFLNDQDARRLLEEHGMTCHVTRHLVRFDVQMVRTDGGQPGRTSLRSLRRSGFSWTLPEVELVGLRFAIDCLLEAAAPMCYRDYYR